MDKLSIILLNAFPDKKLKSLGNKCLIKLSSNCYLIDYHINIFNKLFNNPEIIIVGSFESKRLYKYLKQEYVDENIKYIEHDIDRMSNIGMSIQSGISIATHTNILAINSSVLLNKNFRINTQKSSIVMNLKHAGNIGCVLYNNKVINCYYGLNNEIYDILYICSNDSDKFNHILSMPDIKKLYMFEIMNLCINNNITLSAIDVKDKVPHIIDSNEKIKKLKNKLCV